ncbi:hypothetical protein V8C34DRAFT_266919 [Trichoderma compactum]
MSLSNGDSKIHPEYYGPLLLIQLMPFFFAIHSQECHNFDIDARTHVKSIYYTSISVAQPFFILLVVHGLLIL